MGVYINMEMPNKYPVTVTIFPDGISVVKTISGRRLTETAANVPPHSRLIDADALKASLAFAEKTAEWAVPALRAVLMVIDEMPTIIPEDSSKEAANA